MVGRSGSRAKPSPPVELACGSQSTSNTRHSAAASEAAKLIDVVVFPTPPFWFAMAMTRDILARRELYNRLDGCAGRGGCWNTEGTEEQPERHGRQNPAARCKDDTTPLKPPYPVF